MNLMYGIKMFDKLGIRILSLIDNISLFKGDDCKKNKIFIESGVKKTTEEFKKKFLGEIPLGPKVGKCNDEVRSKVGATPNHEISKIYIKLTNQIKSDYQNYQSSK